MTWIEHAIQLNQKMSELKNTLDQALESVQMLGTVDQNILVDVSGEVLAAIPLELIQNSIQQLIDAAEMGDVHTLKTISEELKETSEDCVPLCEKINQLAEEFDFEEIVKLVHELSTCGASKA